MVFGLNEIISKIDEGLKDPIVKNIAIKNINSLANLVDDIPDDIRGPVLDHLSVNHPDVYTAFINRQESIELENDPDVKKEIIKAIIEYRRDGYTYREIAGFLSEDFDIKMNSKKVWRIAKKFMDNSDPSQNNGLSDKNEIYQDKELNSDILNQINELKSEINQFSSLFHQLRNLKAVLSYGAVFMAGFAVKWLIGII